MDPVTTTAITETADIVGGMDSHDALAALVVIAVLIAAVYMLRQTLSIAEKATGDVREGFSELAKAVEDSGDKMSTEIRGLSDRLGVLEAGQAGLSRDHDEIRRDLDREAATGTHRVSA